MRIWLPLASGIAALVLLTAGAPDAAAQAAAGPTPPRLSFIDGAVAFYRPGSEGWTAARLNTPLAAGDALYTDEKANLELQIGSRAFVRAAERTQLSLVNRDRGYLQFSVTAGQTAFDVRTLAAGVALEVDTPNAAFMIEHTGYYRLSVQQDRTYFITRRGGEATLTPARGNALSVAPSEEVVVAGTDAPTVASYVAPELDTWDAWNYARTEHLVDTMSSRYLPSGLAGAEELDHYGDWRELPSYGPAWIPSGVDAGWAPYSTGQWTWDPYYGWTWIDDAPWGWAPFHYGRWIFIDGFWAWTPGPATVRPAYAPALVAFFTAQRGAPAVSWVALSWGEPLIPWWGRAGFVGVPSWRGWGGPHVAVNAAIDRGAAVDVDQLRWRNAKVPAALVSVPQQQFGRGPVRGAATAVSAQFKVAPVMGALPVKPAPTSLAAGPASKVRPSAEVLSRPAVALRAPAATRLPWRSETPAAAGIAKTPVLRVMPATRAAATPPRAAFGTQGGERPAPPLPPRFEEMRRGAAPPAMPPSRETHERAAPGPARAPGPAQPAPPETAYQRAMPGSAETHRTLHPEAEPPRAAPHPEARPEPREERAVPFERRGGAPAAEPPRGLGESHRLPGAPANRMLPQRQTAEPARRPPAEPAHRPPPQQ
ncbi:MAG: hypothetical protein PHY45_00765 [Rhodocyclaceae bacterium]|nr:hypothetical protein [Rhodocyclaceae bacterium]